MCKIQMDSLNLESWILPPCVLQCYHQSGFTHMYEWQKECLRLPGVLDGGKNLVYSAPTGSGKTFIVEMIIARNIVNKGGKAMLIFPYISVAREKLFWLQQLFNGTGLLVDGFMGGLIPAGGITSVDIAVCTIEKANSLINRMIQEDTINQIRILAVDELHFITDGSRGYLLELLLTKLRFISMHQSNVCTDKKNLGTQIVGFSATVSNLSLLAKWLDAVMYETSFRALPLTRYVMVGNEIFDDHLVKIKAIQPPPSLKLVKVLCATYSEQHKSSNKDFQISTLCLETIIDGHSVLVFCPTKQWCESLACTVSENLSKETCDMMNCTNKTSARKTILQSLSQIPVGLDKVLSNTIPSGIAFHHAGLTMEERDIIEMAFRQGTINVIFATSTLSSGVNLPARRVIIRSPRFHGKFVPVHLFHQMAGRAGRKGFDDHGECFVICEKHEMDECRKLFSLPFPVIRSSLCSSDPNKHELSNSLIKGMLEVIGTEIVSNEATAELYYKSTLFGTQVHMNEADSINNTHQEHIKNIFAWLKDNEFIGVSEYKEKMTVFCTKLGKASLFSSLSVLQSLHVLGDLKTAAKSFALDTELHLLYLITPLPDPSEWTKLNWFNFAHILETLGPAEQRVGQLIGINESFLIRMASRSNMLKKRLTKKHERLFNIHTRFYVALILHELVKESSLSCICNKYECNKGYVQSLQQSAAMYAGMITTFCKELGWWSFEKLLEEFQMRLVFGIERDLLDLVKVSFLSNKLARILFNAGFTSCVTLASASYLDVEKVLIKSSQFQSLKKDDWDTEWEAEERQKQSLIRLCGLNYNVTHHKATDLIIKAAKTVVGKTTISTDEVCAQILSLSLYDSKLGTNIHCDERKKGGCILESSFDMFETQNNPPKPDVEDIGFQEFLLNWSTQRIFSVCFMQDHKTNHNNIQSPVEGLAICWSLEEAYFLQFEGATGVTMWESVINVFACLPDHCTVIAINAKNCYKFLSEVLKANPKFQWQDPEIASWVLDSECPVLPKSVSLPPLKRHQHYPSGFQKFQICSSLCCEACQRAHYTFCSMNHCKQIMEERNVFEYYYSVEMQHLLVLAALEMCGICINLDDLRTYKTQISEAMKNLQNSAWSTVGHKFNLYNPADVSKVLFEELNLHKHIVLDKHNSSKPKSTNKLVLQRLCKLPNSHPLPKIIMDWRSVSHSLHKVVYPLCSNHLGGYKDFASHHPTCFTKTSTGRVSMAEPSLQCISKTYDVCLKNQDDTNQTRNLSISLRKMFVATKGSVFLAADYSQLELRLMSHLSEDPNLRKLFDNPKIDAFCEMAANLFSLESYQNVTAVQRQTSKQVCYGILYGMGPASLAEQLNGNQLEARELIKNFWLKYPLLKCYMNSIIELCRKLGYVQTICGRRRSIPLINSTDRQIRSHCERQAINTTIQGSAADLLKSATVKIQEQITKYGWNSARKHADNCHIVHTLHDELIYEIDFKLIHEMAAIVKNCMEHALPLKTEMLVKVSLGPTWGDLQRVENP